MHSLETILLLKMPHYCCFRLRRALILQPHVIAFPFSEQHPARPASNRNNSTDRALLGISCEQCNARFLPYYSTIADTTVVAPPLVKEPSSAKDRTPAITKIPRTVLSNSLPTCPTFLYQPSSLLTTYGKATKPLHLPHHLGPRHSSPRLHPAVPKSRLRPTRHLQDRRLRWLASQNSRASPPYPIQRVAARHASF